MSIYEIFLIISRTIFSYFFLIIILKIMGKRELSQVSMFDLVIFLIMSELFSLALNDINISIFHFIIPIVIIVLLEILSAKISLKSYKVKKFFEGSSSYLIYKGELQYTELKKNRYNISDLMLQLRCNNIQSPIEVEYAILEANGQLNIIKKDELIVMHPEPIIIDGEINNQVLKQLELTEDYVYAIISKEGYTSPKEIFFAQLLKNQLYVVPFEKFSNSKKIN